MFCLFSLVYQYILLFVLVMANILATTLHPHIIQWLINNDIFAHLNVIIDRFGKIEPRDACVVVYLLDH